MHQSGRGTPSYTRAQAVKAMLWSLVGAAAVVTVARFWHGLGATTALSDRTPWGLWIGFDVMGGVALAAGGFVVAGAVYVFHLDRFRPILRPAILTAFLGYAAVVVGLLFDLGLPHNIWRPVVHWQHHSAMFEVAWCVILYLTVLILEVSPMVLERSPFRRAYRLVKRLTIPLVILGIMLSTLHQSSLGTLVLIMPFRIHPLWYSPIMPALFFVSAVGLGLMMVTAESLTTAWIYRRRPELDLLSSLSSAARWVLALYLLLRLGDLWLRGKLQLDDSLQAALFVVELGITAAVVLLLSIPKIRASRLGLGCCSSLVVVGFVLNRLTVSGVATLNTTGGSYVPSLSEVLVSAGVVASAALVFFYFVEHFQVLADDGEEPPRPNAGWRRVVAQNGLAFAAAAALTYAVLPSEAISGPRPMATPVKSARGGSLLLIDGNRRHQAVAFDHGTHKELLDDDKSCAKCHHMNRPLEKSTRCNECHRDMYLPTLLFDHQWHASKLGHRAGCKKTCHLTSRGRIRACKECHTQMRPAGTLIRGKGDWVRAPGYKAAMHGLCVGCHAREQKKSDAEKKPGEATDPRATRLDQCAFCHKRLPDEIRGEIQLLHSGK